MEVKEIKNTGEKISYFSHENGLRVFMWQNSKSHDVNVSLNINYGSASYRYKVNNKIHEDKTGIAHFLEHVMFNISDGYNATETFNKLGTFENAYTDLENTKYYIFTQDNIEENLNLLLTMVFTPYFTKKLVDKEKGIIIEEKKRSNNNPYAEAYEHYNLNLYHNSNYRATTLGSLEDIKTITAKDLKKAYDTFYHPANMELVVTGNFNPYEIEKIINNFFEGKKYLPFTKPNIYNKKEPKTVRLEHEEIFGNVEIPKLRVAVKIPRSNFKNISIIDLYISLILILKCNFGDTSDLREQLFEEELITSISSGRIIRDDYVIISISAETRYPEEVIKKIKKQLSQLTISETDFKRKINSIIGNYITSFDNNEAVNDKIINSLITYHDFIYDQIDIFKNIKYNMVLKVLKNINADNMLDIIIKPKK